MMFSNRLLKPLDYLRIQHEAKRKYDLWLPLATSIAATAILYFLPGDVKIVGGSGLTGIFTGLLQILAGFYIASLAAVATFNKAGMDEVMAGDPPTLRTTFRGELRITELTRRRFLSLLFGYLSFISIFLYLVGTLVALLQPNLAQLTPDVLEPFLKWFYAFLFLFAASNLLITTMLGLFYMADRIHRTEPRHIEPPTETAATDD